MLRSTRFLRRAALPLTLAVAATMLVGAPTASAIVTPREGVWSIAVEGSPDVDVEFVHRLVSLRTVDDAFQLDDADGGSTLVSFALSPVGTSYVSEWAAGFAQACRRLNGSDEGRTCEDAEVRFSLPRVIEKRMRGTMAIRIGDSFSASASVVLRYTTGGDLPPSAPRYLTVDDIRGAGNEKKFDVGASWSPPASAGAAPVEGYRVTLRRQVANVPSWDVSLDSTSDSVSLRGLAPSTTYVLSVSARSGLGLGPAASETFTTPGRDQLAWVVSLGDSFISGEGGRWAGNADGDRHFRIDALGAKAYWDGPSGEQIANCHRSKSAMIHIGVVNSLNLACSGAESQSAVFEGSWKPGIDFRDLGQGRVGQAKLLEDFATTHDVRMVALSIGGNNFQFGKIIKSCLSAFILPSGVDCEDDPETYQFVDLAAQARTQDDIYIAMRNVREAMTNAGKEDSSWSLVSTLYPQPMVGGPDMRYAEDEGALDLDRQYEGGCGFSNEDATWANIEVLYIVNRAVLGAVDRMRRDFPDLNVQVMDSSNAFAGRNLCHKDVKRVSDSDEPDRGGPVAWFENRASDRSEWVVEIEISNNNPDTMQQESMHPNYWGQMALRNCLRQVWNGGNVRGGECTRGSRLNTYSEPNMSLRR